MTATPRRATRVTDMLGIAHPILAGGMQWLSDAPYVASVVNAGGMGFVTCRSYGTADAFRAGLRQCRELTGGAPFGVNISVSARSSAESSQAEMIRTALSEGVRLFETACRGPADALIAELKEAGATVIHKCSTLRHALAAERAGADILGIVGQEEGGHPGPGDLSTLTLAAAAARRLSAPFTVGGGIGSGGQILALLAAGADGVVMGSRLTVAEECHGHPGYKARIVEADETCSITVLRSIDALGGAWRVLRNDTSAEVDRLERAGARGFEDYRHLIAGTITRDHAYAKGDWNRGMVSISPAAGFADRVEPMAAIFARLLDEMDAAEDRLARMKARATDAAPRMKEASAR